MRPRPNPLVTAALVAALAATVILALLAGGHALMAAFDADGRHAAEPAP